MVVMVAIRASSGGLAGGSVLLSGFNADASASVPAGWPEDVDTCTASPFVVCTG